MPSSYNALLDMVYRELTDTLAATVYRSPVEFCGNGNRSGAATVQSLDTKIR